MNKIFRHPVLKVHEMIQVATLDFCSEDQTVSKHSEEVLEILFCINVVKLSKSMFAKLILFKLRFSPGKYKL